jgi:2-polyprenyl-6-hydroxyphenyl methylase/3-demethylubiquinone-9 3-methyltransferase
MSTTTATPAGKIGPGSEPRRFAFGKNWQRFLSVLGDERIAEAEKSLCAMMGVETLRCKSWIDVGSGSGLFSLAAMRLGASRVYSFDYDPQSVACAQELKRRYFAGAANWQIEQGSVLDKSYLAGLGSFDVVYSWGVLHHTGNMWQALENVSAMVRPGGKLFIAIYNDEGRRSKAWRAVKQRYSASIAWRVPIIAGFGSYILMKGFIKDVFLLHKNPLRRFREYKKSRGMSYFVDILDWLGGYPFEVAKAESICDFFHRRGFELITLKTPIQPKGNNEFVFAKLEKASPE